MLGRSRRGKRLLQLRNRLPRRLPRLEARFDRAWTFLGWSLGAHSGGRCRLHPYLIFNEIVFSEKPANLTAMLRQALFDDFNLFAFPQRAQVLPVVVRSLLPKRRQQTTKQD